MLTRVEREKHMVNGHFAAAQAEEQVAAVSPEEQIFRERLREALLDNWAAGFCRMPDVVRQDRTLSPKAKIVYEQLLSYMWFQSDHCWPSQQTLADATGYSRRSVIRACKELYERGYIEKWRRGQGYTNYYFINPLTFPRSFRRTTREPVDTMLLDVHAPELRKEVTTSIPRSLDESLALCQEVTSRSDKPAQPEVPDWHPKQTKENERHRKERSSKTSTAQKGTAFPVGIKTTRNEHQQASNKADSVGAKNNDESGASEAELHQFPSKPNTSSSKGSSQQTTAGRAKGVGDNISTQHQTKRSAIAVATGIPEQHLEEMEIAKTPKQRPIPEFLRDIMSRYSRELGDSNVSTKSNITRAAKLYFFALDYIREAQDDPQGFFSELLYEAKQAAYKVNSIRYRSAGNHPNRIPVFFTCLENLFALSDEELAYIRSVEPLLEQSW